jgi:hypothetical protein
MAMDEETKLKLQELTIAALREAKKELDEDNAVELADEL